MIKVQVYEGDSIAAAADETSAADGARIALKHQLYVPTWLLQSNLAEVRHRPKGKKIALLFKNNVPVAVAFLDDSTRVMQVFVRPEERRHGYGTKVVQAIKPEKRVHAHQGLPDTWRFWEKQGISTKW